MSLIVFKKVIKRIIFIQLKHVCFSTQPNHLLYFISCRRCPIRTTWPQRSCCYPLPLIHLMTWRTVPYQSCLMPAITSWYFTFLIPGLMNKLHPFSVLFLSPALLSSFLWNEDDLLLISATYVPFCPLPHLISMKYRNMNIIDASLKSILRIPHFSIALITYFSIGKH